MFGRTWREQDCASRLRPPTSRGRDVLGLAHDQRRRCAPCGRRRPSRRPRRRCRCRCVPVPDDEHQPDHEHVEREGDQRRRRSASRSRRASRRSSRPACRPAMPKQNGKITASTPTRRSVRAAQSSRESSSRPSSSVPSEVRATRARRGCGRGPGWSGEYGLITGARITASTSTPVSASAGDERRAVTDAAPEARASAPARPAVDAASAATRVASCSSEPDPRVEAGREQVGREVDQRRR